MVLIEADRLEIGPSLVRVFISPDLCRANEAVVRTSYRLNIPASCEEAWLLSCNHNQHSFVQSGGKKADRSSDGF